ILGDSKLKPDSVSAGAGPLRLTFCVAPEALQIARPAPGTTRSRPAGTAVFTFGPRQAKVALRPVEWTEVQPPGAATPLDRGRMTAIAITGQPSPDWLVFRSARWERQADGILLLDILLANLGSNNAGADVSIGYDTVTGCAIGPNTKAEVRANIRYQNGRLTA